jgi:hypothetical protein
LFVRGTRVRAAGRPVAIVLLHRYNGPDAAGAVAGLLRLAAGLLLGLAGVRPLGLAAAIGLVLFFTGSR